MNFLYFLFWFGPLLNHRLHNSRPFEFLILVRDKAVEAADQVRECVARISKEIQEVYDRIVGPYQKELESAETK